MHLSY
jgi:hypothetical protein